MLTFHEIQNCEGYYYNRETGEVLRNVGKGDTTCWTEGSSNKTVAVRDLEAPLFELLTSDVLLPFTEVRRLAQERYGAGPSGFVNRQTAPQSDGSVVTEEAEIHHP